jgi:hypothetical protein
MPMKNYSKPNRPVHRSHPLYRFLKAIKYRHATRLLPVLMLLFIQPAAIPADTFAAAFVSQETGIVTQGTGEYQPVRDRALDAGIAPERIDALIARAMNRQVPPDQLNSLLDPAVSLSSSDLPYNSVLQKAMEGMAKRIPPENIRQVLGTMENGMYRAADLIDPWLNREEVHSMLQAGTISGSVDESARNIRNLFLENTSYAFQNNIREEVMRNFLDQIVAERARMRSGMNTAASAIRTLPDLPISEDDPDAGSRILIRALSSGFTAGEIQQLPAAFRSAQFYSQLPAENIARGLSRQLDRGIPAQHILDNLFQGNVGGGPPGFTPPGLDRDNGDGHPGRGRPPATPPGTD